MKKLIRRLNNYTKISKKKIIGRSVLALICLALLAGLYMGFAHLAHRLCSINNVELTYVSLYSSALKESIQKTLDEHAERITSGKKSMKRICRMLKGSSPLIEHVEWRYDHGNANIFVHGSAPLCTVNNALVLTSQERLESRESFNEYPLASLKNINIQNNENLAHLAREGKAIYSFFKNIPDTILNDYTISYSGAHEIYLTENITTTHKKFIAITSNDQLKNLELLNKAKALSAREEYTKPNTRARSWQYAFDIRFDNRIIAKPYHNKPKEL
jgi:hypothetical protein